MNGSTWVRRSGRLHCYQFAAWFGALSAAACAASTQDSLDRPSKATSGAEVSSSDSGSSSESAGAGTTGQDTSGSGASGGSRADASSTGSGLAEACAATGTEAKPVPLDMILLLDRSGSMKGPRWDGLKKALTEFVYDGDSAGINVGIVYFPIDAPTGQACNYKDYQKLVVDIGPLPYNTTDVVASIQSQDQGDATPMFGAMQGTLWTAVQLKDANPTHKVIVVLVSDGDPNSCTSAPTISGDKKNGTISDIADLAGYAKDQNGVRTYAIAIEGAKPQNLSLIAAAGGTGAAIDVTKNIAQFKDEMKKIRQTAFQCEFQLPEPPKGESLDPNLVMAKLTPSDAKSMEIPFADNLQDCGAKPGWYYDDSTKPTKVILCPASCFTAQQDLKARVDVFFGCAPKVN